MQTPDRVEMRHDFRGGLSDAQVQNLVWQIFRSIADLKDHLRAWAAANGKSKDDVDQAVRGSQELATIMASPTQISTAATIDSADSGLELPAAQKHPSGIADDNWRSAGRDGGDADPAKRRYPDMR